MGTAFALADFIITNAPAWIDSGMKIYDLVTKTRAVIDENNAPGDAAWNDLAVRAAELEARINDTTKDA